MGPRVMQQFSITIPNQLVISSNRQTHVWKKKKLKDHCAEIIPKLAKSIEPVGKATIHVGVTKRTSNRYDPVNLTDTAKPIVDQLVKAGVLDEDDHRHVFGPWLYHKGTDKTLDKAMRFTITLTEYKPDTPF